MRNERLVLLGWLRHLALACIVALGLGTIVGSGGGGGDPPPVETVNINGRVYAGTIAGGTVRAYALRSGVRSLVQESAVGQDGAYTLRVSPEVVLLEYSPSANATLEDIVSRVTSPLPADFILRAVYDFAGLGNRTVTLNITAWSEVATAFAERLGALSTANVNLANSGLVGSMQANFLAAKIIDPTQATAPGTMPGDANVAILNATISFMGSVGAFGCSVNLEAAGRIKCITASLASEARIDQLGAVSSNSLSPSGRKRAAGIVGAITDGVFSFGQAAQSAIVAGYEQSVNAYVSTANAVQVGATAAVTAVANLGSSVLASASNIGASLYRTTHDLATVSAYQSLLTLEEQASEARQVFDFAAISSLIYDPFFISDIGFDASAYSAINSRLVGPDGTQYSLSSGWRTFDWSSTSATIRPKAVSESTSGLQYNIFYNDKFLVIAYRGTEELADWVSDIGIATCTNLQYAKANQIYQTLKIDSKYVDLLRTRKLVLVGHSLGGGIAAYVAAHNPLQEVVAFNPAPLCSADVAIQALTSPGYSRDIRNVVISGEILTGLINIQLGVPVVSRVGDSTIYPNPYLLSLSNQVDSHFMSAVLFALDAARKLNCTQPNCETFPTALTASLAGSATLSTTGAPFRGTLRVIGTGLSTVERITWTCTDAATSAPCPGSPYVWEESAGPERFQFSDTEAILNPILIASGDKAGSYRWEVVLSSRTASAPPLTFTVQYSPPAFDPASLRPLSIPGQVISTAGSSSLTLNFSGAQFNAVQSIEWTWSGNSSGAESWVKGSAEWNANVSIAPDGSVSVRRPISSSIAAAGGSTEWRVTFVSDQGVRATRLFGLTTTPSPASTPNLVAQSVSFTPTVAVPSGPVQVNFVLTNQGTATAAASIATVRINQSSNSEAGPDLAMSSIPSIVAGASFSASVTVNAPATPGTYRLWVIAGNGNSAGPIKPALATGPLTVAVVDPPLGPDIAVRNLTFSPGSVGVGGSIQISFLVTNVGTGPTAPSAGVIRFNGSATDPAGVDAATFNVPALQVGGGHSIAGPIFAPATSGTYNIWVVADSSGTSGESAAVVANNRVVATSSLVVTGGPGTTPVVTSVAVSPAAPMVGAQTTFSVNGTNLQAGYQLVFPGCVPTELASTSTTLRQFACTLTQEGTNLAGTVRASSATMFAFTLTVGPPLPRAPQFEKLAAGYYYSLAVKADGTLWGTGENFWGQLGLPGDPLFAVEVWTQVPSLSGIAAVAAGQAHSLAVSRDGLLWVAGGGGFGVLGLGDTLGRTVWTQVSGLTGFKRVAASISHSLALTNDGAIWATGSGVFGELGMVAPNGVQTWTQVPGTSGFIAIAASNGYSLALKGDGTLWGTGIDGGGLGFNLPQTQGPTILTQFTQIPSLSGVVSIAVGTGSSIAVTADGSLWVTGGNRFGQLGLGDLSDRMLWTKTTLTDVIGAACGYGHCLALKRNGTVLAAGSNESLQLGVGSRTSLFNTWTPVTLPVGAIGLAGGFHHSIAVVPSGTAWAAGLDAEATLGLGLPTDPTMPDNEIRWRQAPGTAGF